MSKDEACDLKNYIDRLVAAELTFQGAQDQLQLARMKLANFLHALQTTAKNDASAS